MRRYIKERRLFYIEFTSLTPFPGTVFHRDVENDILEKNPELYDMQHILLETELPLKEYYFQIMLCYLTAHLPHRAVRARLNLKLSKNPLHPIYRNFVKFLWQVKHSYRDHEKRTPVVNRGVQEKKGELGNG